MAILANLAAQLRLEDKDFQRGLKSAKTGLGGLYKAMTAIAVFDWGFGKAKQSFSFVIDSAIDLETRLSNLRKTTGLGEMGLDKINTKMGELSVTMAGVKLTDLLDIGTIAGRLGVAGDKVANFARDVGMLHIALDDLPVETIANSFARLLTVFNLDADATLRLGSALNRLDDTSSATGKEILDITRRLSGAASVLGLSVQKTMALATTLREAGIGVEVAGTSFTQVLTKMATDTDKFAGIAGVSLQRFTQYLRKDPLLAIQAFIAGLSKMDKLDQFQALKSLKMQGMRTMGSVLQLSQAIGNLPGHVQVANREFNSMNSVIRENEIRGETAGAQIEVMKNHFLLLAQQIGVYTLPVIKDLTKSVGMLAEDVKDFFNRNQGTIQAFAGKVRDARAYLGLFIRDFKIFVELGGMFADEKAMQFIEVLERVGADFGKNFQVGLSNTMVFIKNAMNALGKFLSSFFSQLGTVCAIAWTKALAAATPVDMINNFAAKMLPKAKADQIKDFLSPFDALAKQHVPGINPDVSGFKDDAMKKNTVALPGFRNPFANLPDDHLLMTPKLKVLEQHKREAEAGLLQRQLKQNPIVQEKGKELARPRTDFKRQLNDQNRAKGLPLFTGGQEAAQRILVVRGRAIVKTKTAQARAVAAGRKRLGKNAVVAAQRGEQVASNLGAGKGVRQAAGNVAAQVASPQGQKAIGVLAQAAGQGAQQVTRIVSLAQSIMKKIEDNNKRIGQLEGQGRNQAKRNR